MRFTRGGWPGIAAGAATEIVNEPGALAENVDTDAAGVVSEVRDTEITKGETVTETGTETERGIGNGKREAMERQKGDMMRPSPRARHRLTRGDRMGGHAVQPQDACMQSARCTSTCANSALCS